MKPTASSTFKREAWLDRFIHAPWLTDVEENVRTAWRSWAVARGVVLLGTQIAGDVQAEVVRVAQRHPALGDAQTPVLVDVVLWLLTDTRWIAASVVVDRDPPGPEQRVEVSLALDAVARTQVRSVGLSDLARADGTGAGEQPLQVEFDLAGPGFGGQRGRRWHVGEDLLGIDGETVGGAPYFRCTVLPPDMKHFLSVLAH